MAGADLSRLEIDRERLRCPGCGRFVTELAVLDGGDCLCPRCAREAGERADAGAREWLVRRRSAARPPGRNK